MRIKGLLSILAMAAALLATAAVALAAGDGASSSSKSTAVVSVSARSVPGLGLVLVNSAGRTLYMFVPDKRKAVTCFLVCAKIWPPLKLPAGAKLAAAGGVKGALLSSDADKAGGRVVTYNGWPLYTYLGDSKAGVAAGQALNVNGGLWYVLTPAGALIKTKPSSSSSGSGSKSSGSKGSGTPVKTTTTTAGGGGAAGAQNCAGDPDQDADGDLDGGGPDDGDGCV
jgi:predicted lipoprotein with Yx(FWY)xxD motif